MFCCFFPKFRKLCKNFAEFSPNFDEIFFFGIFPKCSIFIRAFDPELEPDFSAGLKHSSDDSELAELARSLISYFTKQDLPDLQQKLKTYFSKTAHFE